MQSAGAWKMLAECSTRCHLEMWPLGMPSLEDVPCMGIVLKHFEWMREEDKEALKHFEWTCEEDKEALKHFEWMCEEGVQRDDITFVCLLSDCCHAGLVDEGMRCYASMVTDYMISAKLEHYTYMVDLLGCAGHLQDTNNMVMAMPCKPHSAAWKALLGTCRIHGTAEMTERVTKKILEMEPDNATGYVLLSNI
jgi:hypothetical protein